MARLSLLNQAQSKHARLHWNPFRVPKDLSQRKGHFSHPLCPTGDFLKDQHFTPVLLQTRWNLCRPRSPPRPSNGGPPRFITVTPRPSIDHRHPDRGRCAGGIVRSYSNFERPRPFRDWNLIVSVFLTFHKSHPVDTRSVFDPRTKSPIWTNKILFVWFLD